MSSAVTRADELAADLFAVVSEVEDPELPHVTIGDLGMIHSVELDHASHTAKVAITPTYTGCPATEQIVDDVSAAVRAAGWNPAVRIQLSPAWGTERITERGRTRLSKAGIAPPHLVQSDDGAVPVEFPVACPRCGSRRTQLVAQFGSTACKASYRCGACAEPFDYFKPF